MSINPGVYNGTVAESHISGNGYVVNVIEHNGDFQAEVIYPSGHGEGYAIHCDTVESAAAAGDALADKMGEIYDI